MHPIEPEARLGVDVGGTFTDVVVIRPRGISFAKVPTTSPDQSDGVIEGCEVAGARAGEVSSFAHGTTVATNALLERRGASVALVTTEGFRDILEIGRQNRPSLYDPEARKPVPLVPRERRFTIRERMGPDGVIVPLDGQALADVAERIRSSDVRAVAICFLFSYLHPEHEIEAAARLRELLPNTYICASSEILPEFREFERFSATVANAYLAPKMRGYISSLSDKARARGLPEPLVMQSSGGVTDGADASERAAACVLSGPAAGVVGAAFVAAQSGFRNVLSFDMGGTSTDVAPILDGTARDTTDSEVAGVPLRFPIVDVHTVSAGGGSIAWVDEGGALRVGPRSAGARPGPACYGLGGTDPTVSDANLLLGYLGDGTVLGGEITLERAEAEQAVRPLAEILGLREIETALGVRRVANAEMARALRLITVERGLDPRSFSLCAFGGAGPLHACDLADELGIETVLVPRGSGVLSALGLALSDLRRDVSMSFPRELSETSPSELEHHFGGLEREAARGLTGARFDRRADLRYRGQSHELTVTAANFEELASAFQDEHERRYGYAVSGEPIEVVALRVAAIEPVHRSKIREAPAATGGPASPRKAFFGDEWSEVVVWHRSEMSAGSEVTGPAIVEFDEATCLVSPGWNGKVDDAGTLVLRASS